MQRSHCALAFFCWTPLLLCTPALAHGGQYRGPGEVVPPSNNSASSSTNSGSGTSTSAPSPGAVAPTGPSRSASGSLPTAGSAGVAARGPGPRGAALDDDLTRWEFFWEFGKDPYLRLREMVFAGTSRVGGDDVLLNPRLAHRAKAVERPTSADRERIADALVGILRQAHDRDTISACLIALGKIGACPGFDLQAELLPLLQRNDQELRETAALALGISGLLTQSNVDLLLALARDEAAGRSASGQAAVNERTRAFAAYGLGLLLARSRSRPQ